MARKKKAIAPAAPAAGHALVGVEPAADGIRFQWVCTCTDRGTPTDTKEWARDGHEVHVRIKESTHVLVSIEHSPEPPIGFYWVCACRARGIPIATDDQARAAHEWHVRLEEYGHPCRKEGPV